LNHYCPSFAKNYFCSVNLKIIFVFLYFYLGCSGFVEGNPMLGLTAPPDTVPGGTLHTEVVMMLYTDGVGEMAVAYVNLLELDTIGLE
jgi:hypothetical protein